MREEILSRLSPDYPWRELLAYEPSVGSTNDVLKELARKGAPQGTALVAGHQSSGHGRRGRDFSSPPDMGVYLSILLRPNCAPAELMHLTCAVGTAMCDAVEAAAGFRPGIKWTNDLVCGRRKLGGILTELVTNSGGIVEGCVIGIGINCCQQLPDFPPELREMAASLAMVTGSPVSRAGLAAAMLEALCRMNGTLLTGREETLSRYRRDCITLGQEVSLIRGEEIRHGYALDIDSSGALLVRLPSGQVEAVNSGEVSVRGMYGYV
ncbi:MAG: biotin--[acetyl-CoA-carboxylase] ligase [Candidatus Faecousia sp.]|nr:biotin--[acetyl-CoA-carboxylase] ligase [Clostridiales bacterium]MDY6180992.1 biotin--[acetyl-CoA-carboxylase] ligase [Candidatus Faecousia sp.]